MIGGVGLLDDLFRANDIDPGRFRLPSAGQIAGIDDGDFVMVLHHGRSLWVKIAAATKAGWLGRARKAVGRIAKDAVLPVHPQHILDIRKAEDGEP